MKQRYEEQATSQMIDNLLAYLKRMPNFKSVKVDRSANTLYRIAVKKSNQPDHMNLLIQQAKPGYPKDVAATALLLRAQIPPDHYGIIYVPFISERTQSICLKNGFGIIDAAGNIMIATHDIFIDVAGKPNPFKSKRPAKSAFYPKSSRVLRALLAQPQKIWNLSELAAQSTVSMGEAHKVIHWLVDQELLNKKKNGKASMLSLSDPAALLKKWTENYSYKKHHLRGFFSSVDNATCEKEIATYCAAHQIQYALTLTSGAAMVSPHVRYLQSFIYIQEAIDQVAKALNLSPVNSGSNIVLIDPYENGVFEGVQDIDGVNVVSNIQLYIDLIHYPARGEEAADAILANKLKPTWN